MTTAPPPLHDYQEIARDHLRRNPKAGLFLDMGLGKTATVLSTLTPDHLPVLVVAPKRVAEQVWPTEAKLWRPDLKISVAAGTPSARRQALEAPADIYVIGRDNLADAVPHAKRYRTFVMDESSSFKTRGSARWKHARRIARYTPHAWALTGTPSPNGLIDLWAQVYLLDGGQRLGTTLTGFRNRYFLPGRQLANGTITEWLPRPEAEAAIHRAIDDICISMKSEGRIQLPPVTWNEVPIPLPPKVRALYKTFKADLVLDMEALGGATFSAAGAGALTNKLKQLASGFLYHDETDTPGPRPFDIFHREKLKALTEIVEGTGGPVLVFYAYTAEAEQVREAFPPGTVYGPDTPNLQERWNAGELPILLAHPASIGHGLNLQKGPGRTIVWYGLPWSLEEWEQSNKRLLRQGQNNSVVIHTLVAPRTVDVVNRDVLIGKKSVQDALMEHLESPL